MNKDNIVLLPSVAADLELEIESLMQKKDFEGALQQLQLLLSYEHYSYTVYRDTLTCLIKLHYTDEAFELCEELLDRDSEYYYDYLEFYIMLLYEKEAYSELIERVKTEQEEIPEQYMTRINQFKILAMQMKTWWTEEALKSLKVAIDEGDSRGQYRLLLKWEREGYEIPDLFEELLGNNDIHPVIKTELFIFLQKDDRKKDVQVTKFGETLFLSPSAMIPLYKHSSYLDSITAIEEVEQHNPVLYMHAKELINNYAYVLYPTLYHKEEAIYVAEQALAIAKMNLGLKETVLHDETSRAILDCQEMYQEIVLQ